MVAKQLISLKSHVGGNKDSCVLIPEVGSSFVGGDKFRINCVNTIKIWSYNCTLSCVEVFLKPDMSNYCLHLHHACSNL